VHINTVISYSCVRTIIRCCCEYEDIYFIFCNVQPVLIEDDDEHVLLAAPVSPALPDELDDEAVLDREDLDDRVDRAEPPAEVSTSFSKLLVYSHFHLRYIYISVDL